MRINFRLDERRYLVTGAASGIGYEVAKTLALSGAQVLLADLNEEGLAKAVFEIGSKARKICVDLTDAESLKNLLVAEAKEHGLINGFVHCAGIPCIAPLKNVSKVKAVKTIDINTISAIELAKICSSKIVRAKNDVSFVLISSVYGLVGSAANSAYAASKGAIIALTKALAIELAPKNIRVNCVAPGFVRTNMLGNVSGAFDSEYVNRLENLHPLGLGEASSIAEPIAFLLSDASRWITGAVLSVDGGFTAQ